jgi:hypothetical protein
VSGNLVEAVVCCGAILTAMALDEGQPAEAATTCRAAAARWGRAGA